jgi:hypothetical protein
MTETRRDRTLTVLAILFGLLAVSDILKPLASDAQTGFVFFGKRLSGTPNAILGPLFGLYLLVYAIGIWTMRRWALPMGRLYFLYVVANLALFMFRSPHPSGTGYLLFTAVYAIVALAVAGGAVSALSKRQHDLR